MVAFERFKSFHVATFLGVLCAVVLICFSDAEWKVALALSVGQGVSLLILLAIAFKQHVVRFGLGQFDLSDYKAALPAVIMAISFQGISASDRAFASMLEEGTVTIVHFCLAISFLPATASMLGPNIIPSLVKSESKGNFLKVVISVALSVSLIYVGVIYFFGSNLVGLISENGRQEYARFSEGFQIFSFCLLPFLVWSVYSRVFYVIDKPWVPTMFAMFALLVNICGNYVFVSMLKYEIFGLGLASILTWLILAFSSMIYLHRNSEYLK